MRGVRWVGDESHLVFGQKLLGEDGIVRWGIDMVKQPGLFSPKFGAVFAHFHAVTAKHRSITRNSKFGLLGPVLCTNTTAV
jgi:hypothetical protein